MRLENSCEAAKTGRLHVDFAQVQGIVITWLEGFHVSYNGGVAFSPRANWCLQARDDLYEWECKNRTVNREQRHIITDLR